MLAKDIILLFRRHVDDLEQPYLWSDTEALQCAHETQRDAVERAFLIEDDVRITVRPDVASYLLDPKVLRIDRAKLDSQKSPLSATTRNRMDDKYSQWESTTGTPHSFIDDTRRILLVWTPTVADVLRLRVKRFPVDLTDLEQPLEIAERYQDAMKYGMAERLYGKNDSDAFNLEKSQLNAQLFTAAFGEKRDANVDRKQRENRRRTTRVKF